ncbi:MAG: hypothetical protein U0174_23110 [Polyangiaceae bacterium]
MSADTIASMKKRAARVEASVRRYSASSRRVEQAEDGLSLALIAAAWPALRAIFDEAESAILLGEWCENVGGLSKLYLLPDEQPCALLIESNGWPKLFRGEKLAKLLVAYDPLEVAEGLDNALRDWESDTEDADLFGERLHKLTAMRESLGLVTHADAKQSRDMIGDALSLLEDSKDSTASSVRGILAEEARRLDALLGGASC